MLKTHTARRALVILVTFAIVVPMIWPWSAPAQEATTQPAAPEAQPAAPEAQPAAPEAQPAAEVSPEAKDLLDRVVKAYSELKTLKLAGTINAEFDVQQQQDKQSAEFTAAYSAPNSFRHAVEGNVTAGSTGEKAYAHSAQANIYINAPAPKEKVTTENLPQPLGEVLNAENLSLALAVSSDPRHELVTDAKSITAASQQIDGKEYPVLRIQLASGPEMDLRIDPATHLIRHVLVNLKPALERQGAVDVKLAQMTIDYTTSEPGAELAADAFAWTPPAGARDIDELRREQAGDRDAGAQAWEGKDAPDFKLPGLDGKEVALKDLRGSPVLLDFWATWCGPCVASMPHVEAIHREKSQKGLKVYAINIGEEKDDVQKFVEQKGWQLPILLDADSSIGVAYGANAIPYQVLIDKEGKIRKVVIGAGESSRQAMAKAIDEVLGQ